MIWGIALYRYEAIKKRRDKISLTLCKKVYTFINISIVKKNNQFQSIVINKIKYNIKLNILIRI